MIDRCNGGTLAWPAMWRFSRPESVVILTASVRAAHEVVRRNRVEGLKEGVSDVGYSVSSKDLAQRVLSINV